MLGIEYHCTIGARVKWGKVKHMVRIAGCGYPFSKMGGGDIQQLYCEFSGMK